jgi:hypothetical protein
LGSDDESCCREKQGKKASRERHLKLVRGV